MAYIYNLTDTWNAAGTTFAGIKMAVTNTASSASSKLLDLSVSGATTGSFTVDKSGSGAFSAGLTSGANSGTGGSFKLFGATSGDATINVPVAAGTATIFTLPATNGTANYALTTNGSGVTSWNQISLTAAVTGVLPVANGGSGTATAFTAGSMVFAGASGVYSQDNANFYWDNTNKRLSIGSTSNVGRFNLYTATNAENVFYMFKSGQVEMTMGFKSSTDSNFYIGTGSSTIGTYGVYLSNTASSWSAVSDERMKVIVEPIESALNKLSDLRTVIGYYKLDASKKRRAFLIAQDVATVLPEAVDDSDPNKLGLAYTDVIPLLVSAIKELKSEFDAYVAAHP